MTSGTADDLRSVETTGTEGASNQVARRGTAVVAARAEKGPEEEALAARSEELYEQPLATSEGKRPNDHSLPGARAERRSQCQMLS